MSQIFVVSRMFQPVHIHYVKHVRSVEGIDAADDVDVIERLEEGHFKAGLFTLLLLQCRELHLLYHELAFGGGVFGLSFEVRWLSLFIFEILVVLL